MTRGFLALLSHSARRIRWLLVATAGLLVGFQALTALMAASFQEQNTFERLATMAPDFVREALGASFLPMLSFSGIVLLGFFHFAVIAFLVGLAIAVATEPASEVEQRFNDVLLARPLPRRVPITRSAVLLVLVALCTCGAMCACTWGGLAMFAPEGARWPRPRLVLSLGGLLAALMVSWGGIALAVGSASRRRGVAGTLVGLVALALFLLDVVSGAWKPAASFGRLSPFHYFDPLKLVAGQPFSWTDLSVLLGVGAAGFLASLFIYTRRDL
ncbi:MAG: hypothetical protein EHM13_13585 [Acidobacteria bacterium]|nr:MAG: hypothetical protein EHM13_13585 [Acidobacteriota bacterium]